MKIIINGVVHDADETPIAVVFDSDAERIHTVHNLLQMTPKEGRRVYAVMPDDMKNKDAYFNSVVSFALALP